MGAGNLRVSVLGMDAQQLRRVLYDFFRFNPADFIVQATVTGYLVRANKKATPKVISTTDISGYGGVPGLGTLETTFPANGALDFSPVVVNVAGASPNLGIMQTWIHNDQVHVLWRNFDASYQYFTPESGYTETTLTIYIP